MKPPKRYEGYETRLLNLTSLCAYLSIGENKAAEIGKAAGAVKHLGKRCLYDKILIDKYIDEIGE